MNDPWKIVAVLTTIGMIVGIAGYTEQSTEIKLQGAAYDSLKEALILKNQTIVELRVKLRACEVSTQPPTPEHNH